MYFLTSGSSSTIRMRPSLPFTAWYLGIPMILLRARRCDRKLNAERRPHSLLALDADSASVLDDKRVHDAQPQPRALPRILGCKERVKNFADHRLWDAGACIGNEDSQGLSLSGCGKSQT